MFNLKDGRVHGNGFIQFDLAPGVRLHIWPPQSKPIKAQSTSTPIHDHVFGFDSYVLTGMLTNIHYEISEPLSPGKGTHHMYQAEKQVDTEDTLLVKQGTMEFKLHQSKWDEIGPSWGDRFYSFEALKFHESLNATDKLVATIMVKTRVLDGYKPRVFCKTTETPDNDFSRYSVDPKLIQEYVDELESIMKNQNTPGFYWKF